MRWERRAAGARPGCPNLANRLAEAGRADEAGPAWEAVAAGLAPVVAAQLGVLRVAWEWVRVPTREAERAVLLACPELLAEGCEALLFAGVLRYQALEEARRYTAILAAARERGVKAALRV
jgi:hypothetical protein